MSGPATGENACLTSWKFELFPRLLSLNMKAVGGAMAATVSERVHTDAVPWSLKDSLPVSIPNSENRGYHGDGGPYQQPQNAKPPAPLYPAIYCWHKSHIKPLLPLYFISKVPGSSSASLSPVFFFWERKGCCFEEKSPIYLSTHRNGSECAMLNVAGEAAYFTTMIFFRETLSIYMLTSKKTWLLTVKEMQKPPKH